MNRLKILAGSIALVLASTAYAHDAGLFRSEAAGFEVRKPQNWSFVTADQNLENLQRTRLNDEAFKTLAVRYISAPLVAMAKYREPFDDVNPSVKVNIRAAGQFRGQPATELLNALLPQFKRLYKDFVMVQAPMSTAVSGLPAAYMRANYSLQTADGRSFPATSELWLVPRGAYMFLIGAGTRQDERTGSRAEIAAILGSVRIDR
jgi:hypothetical protein